MTKAIPLVPIASLSLLMIVVLVQLLLPIPPPVAPTTAPEIAIVLISHVMPVHHKYGTNAVSAKIPTRSNGLSANCTIPPLVPKLPKILRQNCQPLQILYVSCLVRSLIWFATTLQLWLSLHLPCWQYNVTAALLSALVVALAVALAAVIAMTMIVITAAPPVPAIAATMFATIIFCLLPSIGPLILQTANQSPLLMLSLRFCHILTDLAILPGTPNQMKILITHSFWECGNHKNPTTSKYQLTDLD